MSDGSSGSGDMDVESSPAIGSATAAAGAPKRYHNPSTVVYDHADTFEFVIDEENLPDLSAYITSYKFWWKFAVWPLVFGVVNGIVFGTLIVFDEYEFRNRREIEQIERGEYYSSRSSRHENSYLNMLRYNATVFAIMLVIDAALLYFAAAFVQKQVLEWNDLVEEGQEQPGGYAASAASAAAAAAPFTHNRHYVHAQVSRKIDGLLGRTHKNSILVSLLLLASVFCVAFAGVSMADYAFTWTSTAKKKCHSSFGDMEEMDEAASPDESNEQDDANAKPKNDDIAGIPPALQTWAKQTSGMTEWEMYGLPPQASSAIVQLTDGTTFVTAVDPHKKSKSDSSSSGGGDDDETGGGGSYMSPWGMGGFGSSRLSAPPVLVAMSNTGTLKFLPKIVKPRSFTVWTTITKNGTESLNAPGFCCLYNKIKRSTPDGYLLSLMCADSSDTASLFDTTTSTVQVRNVTLDHYNDAGNSSKTSKGAMDDDFMSPRTYASLQYSSLTWYNNCVWVMMTWRVNHRTVVEYYNVTVGPTATPSLPLQLVPVTTRSRSADYYADPFGYNIDSYNMIGGEARSCGHTRKYIRTAVLAIALIPAALWLWRIRQMAVGVVPLCAVLAVLLACINGTLSMALCSSVAAAAALTVNGCGVPILTLLSGEELTWILYGSMVAAANVGMRRPEEFCGVALGACVLVGTLLGHPALYLVGWIGGIGCVVAGIFFTVVMHSAFPLVLVAIGIIGGVGCVVVGRMLITYRAYLRYYSHRAWQAMNTRLQSVAPRNRPQVPSSPHSLSLNRNQHDGSITAGLLHTEG